MSEPIQNTQANNKRIAKNTIMLYIRMMLMMCVALYTSRVVLQTLGVEDYGIYNVVGGFVAMFAFLNGAMSGGTQRFLLIALGEGNYDKLKRVFSTCFLTHALIALIVFVLAETVGLWFVLEKLVIPADRMTAAIWVYECSILSSIITIISMPYNAAIIAHEKMSAFAYISILEAILKLGIVFLLLIGNIDRLILYSVLYLLVGVAIRFVYTIYCNRKFEESRYTRIWDKDLFKQIVSFTGWNLWGNIALVMMTQGVNIVLNVFFGPAVNAARALAVQVQGAVLQFSQNFQMALNPQITKQYAMHNLQQMHSLVIRSAKFTFMLLLCISMPILIETPRILSLWLTDVPDYTVTFVRLMICITFVDAIANSLITAANATGKIKIYQIVVGGILLMIVPVSYISLRICANPTLVFVVHLCIAIIALITRLFMSSKLVNMPIASYLKGAILPILVVGFVSCVVIYPISIQVPNNNTGFIINLCQSVIVSGVVSFLLGFTKHERSFIIDKVKTTIHHR